MGQNWTMPGMDKIETLLIRRAQLCADSIK
jgi:hypothetical protein